MACWTRPRYCTGWWCLLAVLRCSHCWARPLHRLVVPPRIAALRGFFRGGAEGGTSWPRSCSLAQCVGHAAAGLLAAAAGLVDSVLVAARLACLALLATLVGIVHLPPLI